MSKPKLGIVIGSIRPNRFGGHAAQCHAIELQMAPIRSAIHILFPDYLAVIKDGKPLSELEHLNQAARQMLDQLAWWTAALKAAREKSLRQAA
jgi:hypothetical protein